MVSETERQNSIEMMDRIEQLRRAAGIRKAEMYKATGTSSSAFSQWRSGLTKPSPTSISALADFFGVSKQFLMFGEKGKPASKGELSPQQRELMDLIQTLRPSDIAVLLAAARELAAAQQYPVAQE